MEEDGDDLTEEVDVPPAASGHTLELLTWLGFCLLGGQQELQNVLFSSSSARTSQQEDVLADLVRYLKSVGHIVEVSMAQKNKQPLRILSAAFLVLEQVIRGPNRQAVESLVNQTEIIETTHELMGHLHFSGCAFDCLKFDVQRNILRFILTMLQNLSPDHGTIARKWVSNGTGEVLLSAWRDVHEYDGSGNVTADQLQQLGFLHYAVLAYLSDLSGSAELQSKLSEQSEAYKECVEQCGCVEVTRDGTVYKLRFQIPMVCTELRGHESFTSAVSRVVSSCVTNFEEEEERPADFQERINAVIASAVRQREPEGSTGFRGFLLRNENVIHHAPLIITLLLNLWLVVFESLINFAPEALAAEGSDACAGNDSESCLAVATDEASVTTESVTAELSPAFFAAQLGAGGVLKVAGVLHIVLYTLRFCLVAGALDAKGGRKAIAVEFSYVAASLVGNIFSPFFFATHVLECFGHESAQILLSAATLNLSKLGQAALIIVLTVYVYAVVGYGALHDRAGDGKCSTLINCAISYLDGGLKGDGIHEALEFKTPYSFWGGQVLDWFLQIFCMTFLIIIVQVLMAIFSGIIIDSFGELRDSQAELASHLQEKDHILSNQVHWNYVNFLVFIHCSKLDELTDLQQYVSFQVRCGHSSWLSYRLSLDFEGGQNADSADSAAPAGVQGFADSAQFEEVVERLDRMERRLDESLGMTTDRITAVEKQLESRWTTIEASLRRLEAAACTELGEENSSLSPRQPGKGFFSRHFKRST
jgi:hypothetical protein